MFCTISTQHAFSYQKAKKVKNNLTRVSSIDVTTISAVMMMLVLERKDKKKKKKKKKVEFQAYQLLFKQILRR
jgi:preprotein translocase subunit SecG